VKVTLSGVHSNGSGNDQSMGYAEFLLQSPSGAQFVVLGAGFDTRAYGPLSKQGLAMFELDQAANQRVKRKAVRRAGLGGDHVNYIAVDFAQPQWIKSLTESPYGLKCGR